MEATGYSRWFERLLTELGFETWMGDPAEIKAKRVKKRKTDREDARLLLRLMRETSAYAGCENTNLLLRQYFPRGTDLSGCSQAQLDQVALRLNKRPRKTLRFQTPASKLQASVASTI